MAMHDQVNAFELGKEITDLARSKTSKGTHVISVRLSSGEVAKLEKITQMTGKNFSQLVREAVLNHYASMMASSQPVMTMYFMGDSLISFTSGSNQQVTQKAPDLVVAG